MIAEIAIKIMNSIGISHFTDFKGMKKKCTKQEK